MNILILCKKFPYPLKEGEPIAISYLARAFKEKGCSVSLFVLNTSKHFFDLERLPKEQNFYHKIHSVKINNDINIGGAIKSMLRRKSYILSRFYSKEYECKLAEVLSNHHFDVIQLETIYMAHYIATIRKYSTAVIALRSHNVEHLIWKRVAATTPSIIKSWYLRIQNKSLQKFELEQLNECDVLVAITSKDLKIFKKLGFYKKGIVAPVGINLDEYPVENSQNPRPYSIAFIGALDWIPNQDGVVWFLEKVWPKLSDEFPEASFHIAGKNTPQWMFKKTTKKIVVHGEVDNAKTFIKSHPIMIAPLFSGSGIKIKVLEGMALGRIVVTTKVGVEGIPAKNGKHLMVANDAQSFYQAIRECFTDASKKDEIGVAGIELIKSTFDDGQIAERVLESYQKLSLEKQKT